MFAVCVARDSDAGLNAGKAKPLYHLLVSFADVSSRDTSQGYPYRAVLASALDCSKQTVDRAAEYLEKEIGLVTVVRRKVEGKEDENDANLYRLHDAWLIHGVPAPADTPPQLVARYGHTVPGFDVAEWIREHAPRFDLSAWEAKYAEQVSLQEAKREEQRQKERARRKKAKAKKSGGGVMDDATPDASETGGGGVMGDATGDVMGDATGGVMGDALSRAGSPEPSSTATTRGSAAGQSAGGLTRAGRSFDAGPQDGPAQGGCAADPKKSLAKKRTARKLTEARPVAGEDAVWEILDAILAELGQRPGSRPPTLRKAVRLFLGHDTDARGGTAFALYPRRPEHATVRLNRGWHRAQGPERSAAGYDGPDPIRRPVGYLAEVLTAQDCLRPECEQGVLLTTGAECGECEQAKAERIGAALAARLEQETAQAAAQRAPRAGQFDDVDRHQDHVLHVPEQRATWHCETVTCRRPGRGTPPEIPLCDECLEDIHTALAGAANSSVQA